MKQFKSISFLSLMFLVMISSSQCSSTKKLQNSAPFKVGDGYYEPWIVGVKNAGSGINLFIPLVSNPNNIILDSVYFRGKQSKLEIVNKKLFGGRFETATNQKKDVIMSSEPYAEYGNNVPELPKKSPFKLKNSECVISYKQGNSRKYYKISNLIIKEPKHYLNTRPNKQ